MTRLAFGLKCGAFGASGFSVSPDNSSERIPGSNSPPEARDRMACLRIMALLENVLLDKQKRVAAEHRMDIAGPCLCLNFFFARRFVLVLQLRQEFLRLLQLRSRRR